MPAVAKWDDRAKVVPFSTSEGRIFVIGNQNDKDMSVPGDKYIEKVVRWVNGTVELERMNLRPDQRFRAILCMEVYRKWIESPTTDVREMVKRLSARDYALFLQQAEMGLEDAKEIVQAVGIRRDANGIIVARKECEIANDIYTVNKLCGRLSVSQEHLDKVLYRSNTRWLSHFGQTTGSVSAIKEAQRNLEVMNNGFKGDANPADALRPGIARNAVSDISIIKPDRENYTPEQIRAFAKKIGARVNDVQEFIENEDGEMVPVNSDDEELDGQDAEISFAGFTDESDRNRSGGTPTDEPDTYDPFNQ